MVNLASSAAQPSCRVCIGKKDMEPTTVKGKLTNRKNVILVAFTCKRFLSLKNNKVRLGDLLWQMDKARPYSYK